MKATINQHGILHITRGSYDTRQMCPRGDEETHCGHWCPLFSEPYTNAHGVTVLNLCEKTLHITDFTDERSTNGNS